MALLKRSERTCARRRAARFTCAVLFGALWCASSAYGQASEVSLKSAFLYKFVHYAEWPAEALGAPGDPIALCVLGHDDVAHVLEGAVRGRTWNDRTLVVRRLASPNETDGCHVLFVGSVQDAEIERLLARVASQATLTVGDAEGFARRGGIINFTRSGSRLGFEINRDAAQRAGLQLSSQLLKLSKLVPEQSGGN